jgi:hypothetical protein
MYERCSRKRDGQGTRDRRFAGHARSRSDAVYLCPQCRSQRDIPRGGLFQARLTMPHGPTPEGSLTPALGERTLGGSLARGN